MSESKSVSRFTRRGLEQKPLVGKQFQQLRRNSVAGEKVGRAAGTFLFFHSLLFMTGRKNRRASASCRATSRADSFRLAEGRKGRYFCGSIIPGVFPFDARSHFQVKAGLFSTKAAASSSFTFPLFFCSLSS